MFSSFLSMLQLIHCSTLRFFKVCQNVIILGAIRTILPQNPKTSNFEIEYLYMHCTNYISSSFSTTSSISRHELTLEIYVEKGKV